MGLVASLFSALKAEVDWLITSLAVASGSETAVSGDTQTADSANTSYHDSPPDAHAAIASVVVQQADNDTPDHSQHASGDDALSNDAKIADIATGHPANLITNADFIIDTTDHSGPAPSPGLTPISFESSASDLSSITTPAGAPTMHDQDFHVAPPEIDSHMWIAQSHSAAGDFALASLVPQLGGDLARGSGGGGGGSGSGSAGPTPSSYTSGRAGHLQITLNFDSSVASAPTDASFKDINPSDVHYNPSGNAFIADMEQVADFFTSNFSNNTHITVNAGFGEIAGQRVGSDVLGESEAYYVQVPTTTQYSTQYANLQHAFSTYDPAVSTPLPGAPSGNQVWYVTTAEGKALGFANAAGSPDGYVGFTSAAGKFFYNPASVVSGAYDFTGVAAHEISEIMGRATLDATKYFGGKSPEFMPLDLFHYTSPGNQTFSGGTQGYFSLDGSQTAGDYMYFNTNSSGDQSDWALSPRAPGAPASDAFDWSGGASEPSTISYADYLTMEAVGYNGTFSGTWHNWG